MTGRKSKNLPKKDPSEPRKPRKKVSRSKRVKRIKQKSQKPKSSVDITCSSSDELDLEFTDSASPSASANLPTLSIADPDLAECMFSDDEERAAYLNEVYATCGHVQCQAVSLAHDVSLASGMLSPTCLLSDRDSVMSSTKDSFQDRPSSSHSQRSSSAASFRPGSPESFASCAGSIEIDESSVFAVPQEPVSFKSNYSGSGTSGVDASVCHVNLDLVTSPSGDSAGSPPDDSEIFAVPPPTLIERGLTILRNIVPNSWIPVADEKGIHLILLSTGYVKSIQRDVFISYVGKEDIMVHCQSLSVESDLHKLISSIDLPTVKFEEDTLDEFCRRALKIVQFSMQFKVCIGANNKDFKGAWDNYPETYVDLNPYQESSYDQTCRSLSCSLLIEIGKKLRCKSCVKLLKNLRPRAAFLRSEVISPDTRNTYLSSQQKDLKLQAQAEELKRRGTKIIYLTGKISRILDKEGVEVDEDLSSSLYSILSKSEKLTDLQKMFLLEQTSCADKANSRSHRWHPSLIRLALYIRMQSASAYDALRDSGVIKLPCTRTLFDYSHAFAPEPGVSEGMLKIISDKIAKVDESHQKYVALMLDEMYISKNLVYRQSDGSIVGFVHLSEVEKEITRLDNYLNGKAADSRLPLASKMLAFMVKGLTSSNKAVIASYPCNKLTKDMLYERTWEVISRSERAGVRVLIIVCDGSSVNRAFIDMHTPLTKTQSGLVFDTLNWCSPDYGPLFFLSDVAHLIKTIRNCWYNSGEGPKKSRCLQFNGQKIEWKVLIRLYLTYKQCNLRKSCKLSSQNVFPNSYSCMNVKHAVHVLSETVATDIELQNWKDTEELVAFIRRWNRFFDCLNGLHLNEHTRKRNPDLAPYTDMNDNRFEWLLTCLDYLEEWRKQAAHLPPKEQGRSMLSYQTMQGIEITIRGFTAATRYLLKEGAKYVMARAFSQDHLENYFSRQRAKGGGSTNPNAFQFLSQQVSMGVQSDLGVKRRNANVEQDSSRMQLSEEPLPKRKKSTKTSAV